MYSVTGLGSLLVIFLGELLFRAFIHIYAAYYLTAPWSIIRSRGCKNVIKNNYPFLEAGPISMVQSYHVLHDPTW